MTVCRARSQEKYDIQVLMISNDMMDILIKNLTQPIDKMVSVKSLCNNYIKVLQRIDPHIFNCYTQFKRHKDERLNKELLSRLGCLRTNTNITITGPGST